MFCSSCFLEPGAAILSFFFVQAEDGIRDPLVTGVQTCALPIFAIRYAAEASQYGDMWRKLLQDAENAGLLRPDLEPMAARMMVLGALNWAAEWWNPRRGSLDTVVRTAQSLVRHGLADQHEGGDAGTAVRKPRPRKRPTSS